jgi:membrane associated rhomboid family serine protease
MDEPAAMEAETPAKEPFFRAPKVVLILIALLVVVHAAIQLAGESWRVWGLYAFSFIPARITGDQPIALIPGSQVWSFLTYAFLHGNWSHLFSNCIWLLIFGSVVARRLHTFRFLLLAGISAIAGAASMLVTHWADGGNVIGASGAVSGVMAAAIPIMFGRGMRLGDTYRTDLATVRPLRFFEILTHRGAFFFMAVLFAVTLYSGATGWTGTSYLEYGGIAWEAHFGGFIAGLFTFYWLDPRN